MSKFVINFFLKITIAITLVAFSLQSYAKSERHLFVISDTHLGIGKVDSNERWNKQLWDNMEDFRWHKEFDDFISLLLKKSQGKADLVIGGDFLELWQARDSLCNHSNKNISCNEIEALIRVSRVIKQHKQVFNSLNRFVNEGNNRLIIIPGNHDAALLYVQVKKKVLAQFSNSSKVEISRTGLWLNEDKKIVIDHGQQLTSDVNKFDSWPSPFITNNNKNHLHKTWGEQFVQKFFNDFEDEIPLIDNISSEFEGFSAGIKYKKWPELKSALSSGIVFLYKHMSFKQTIQILGEAESIIPSKVRAAEKASFFYKSLATDSPLYNEVKLLVDAGDLDGEISKLTDDEINLICSYRSSTYKQQNKDKIQATIFPCQTSNNTLAAAGTGILISKNKEKATYIKNLENRLLASGKTNGIDIYIYGHTHKYEKSHKLKKGGWSMTVLNTGAWQRVVSIKELEKIAKKLKIKDPFTVDLNQLPACYTYVYVEPYVTDKPTAKLKKWGKNCDVWGLDIDL